MSDPFRREMTGQRVRIERVGNKKVCWSSYFCNSFPNDVFEGVCNGICFRSVWWVSEWIFGIFDSLFLGFKARFSSLRFKVRFLNLSTQERTKQSVSLEMKKGNSHEAQEIWLVPWLFQRRFTIGTYPGLDVSIVLYQRLERYDRWVKCLLQRIMSGWMSVWACHLPFE